MALLIKILNCNFQWDRARKCKPSYAWCFFLLNMLGFPSAKTICPAFQHSADQWGQPRCFQDILANPIFQVLQPWFLTCFIWNFTPLEKEIPVVNTSIFRFHVKLWGCYMVLYEITAYTPQNLMTGAPKWRFGSYIIPNYMSGIGSFTNWRHHWRFH